MSTECLALHPYQEEAVAAYQAHALDRKALIFTPAVNMADRVAEAFQEAGISAEGLDGATPLGERWDILERLRSGETK